jgi:hypothetical protein
MRELTDRELDAVCGGLSISFSQSLWNKQVNAATVTQTNAWGFANQNNSSSLQQQNNANNQNQIAISF